MEGRDPADNVEGAGSGRRYRATEAGGRDRVDEITTANLPTMIVMSMKALNNTTVSEIQAIVNTDVISVSF
jgi:hypothetical protein